MEAVKSFGKFEKGKAFFASVVVSVLFWIAKKWNKHNTFLNIWMRSTKDMKANGTCRPAKVDMSTDGRARVRFGTWVIYIGHSNRKPKSA